ncbi:MAG: trypsin-like peptidase domain-containing protein [Pseudomonadota bacterium]
MSGFDKQEIRVLARGGANSHSGMGFVISVDRAERAIYAMTCAHVVAQALLFDQDEDTRDRAARGAAPGPDKKFDVTLTRSRLGAFHAVVADWHPLADPPARVDPATRADDISHHIRDIAVLKITEDARGNRLDDALLDRVSPVVPVPTNELTHRRFRTFGHEGFADAGRGATGEIDTLAAGGGWWSTATRSGDVDHLKPGFSGGGVWSDDGRLLGMVVAGRPGVGLGYVIPVRILAAASTRLGLEMVRPVHHARQLSDEKTAELLDLLRTTRFDELVRGHYVSSSMEAATDVSAGSVQEVVRALLDMQQGDGDVPPLINFLTRLEHTRRNPELRQWIRSVVGEPVHNRLVEHLRAALKTEDVLQIFLPIALTSKGVEDPDALVFARLNCPILRQPSTHKEDAGLDVASCKAAVVRAIRHFESFWFRKFRVEIFVPLVWLAKTHPECYEYSAAVGRGGSEDTDDTTLHDLNDLFEEVSDADLGADAPHDPLGHVYAVTLRVLDRVQPRSPSRDKWLGRDKVACIDDALKVYWIESNESRNSLVAGTPLQTGFAALKADPRSLAPGAFHNHLIAAVFGGLDFAVWRTAPDGGDAAPADSHFDDAVARLAAAGPTGVTGKARQLRKLTNFALLWDDPTAPADIPGQLYSP